LGFFFSLKEKPELLLSRGSYATGLTGSLLLTESTTTTDFGFEFFRHTVVAHIVSGALGEASFAGGSLGELSAFVGHAGDSLETVSGGRAGLGSREMALAHHASAHRLAHGIISAVTVDHHEFGPVSRAAELEVHAALGLAGNIGAVSIAFASLHVLGLNTHDVAHHHLTFGRIHGVHGISDGHSDQKSDDEELHDAG